MSHPPLRVLATLGLALPVVQTPPSGVRDVSELLRPIRERQDLPGLAAAVVQGKELVALGAVGVRRRGDETRMTAEDRFHLGSCTKSMTATMIAMGWGLAERDWARGQVLPHSGSNTMWFCVTWIAPEEDFAVLVATNQGGDKAAKGCDEAAWPMIQEHLAASKEARGDAGEDKTGGKR